MPPAYLKGRPLDDFAQQPHSSCGGKLRYDSYTKAMKAMNKSMSKRVRFGLGSNVYRCMTCRGWHIGTGGLPAWVKYFPIFLLLVIYSVEARPPPADEIPTTCDLVGNFAFWVATQRMEFVPEEDAGRISVPKAAYPKLREIVRMVYETGLSPPSAGFFAWRICEDTNEKADRR